MEYKRLTKKDKRGFYHYNCTEKDQEDCVIMENCGECYGTRVLYRLAELEDKIEHGTLIDTEERFIVEDELWGSKNKFLICKHHIETLIEDFCPTREEAEKKLEELKNEK